MRNSQRHNPFPFTKCVHKNDDWISQKKTIFLYLEKNVATASMVSKATKIAHKNICRYKSDLQKAGKLWEVERKPCKLTGHMAYYLTCDPSKAPISSIQTKLF